MHWKLAAFGLLSLHASFALANYEQGTQELQSKNYASALYEFRQSAETGNPDAQYRLATMYQQGIGTPQKADKATKWYRLAADSGHPAAQVQLANQYLQDDDDDDAARWYKRAANQGETAAQFRLGLMYLEGRGVEQDDAQAAKWLGKAAEQGITAAQNNLGSLYEDGRGVEQDNAMAVKWYRQAAEGGDAYAQNSLGAMYAQGKGVDQNHAWATFWFALAAAQGNEVAAKNIASSQKHLQTATISVGTANIRAGSSTDYDIVTKAHRGDTLRILGSNSGWSQVYLPGLQQLGWVASRLLE
ncbi:SH3 domain-containing protein [Halomonas piscis]|uniref:SH3 domain-containing protein n=1 Tax=Halomonas piscis TaxID=3031727 RepID=A0ABY9Z165_9GAMM|nr:SH3 domain-containing protein [Halomonas piscis]WNK20421.1 SH3 domain-containing protein [Halomonas piscis]